MSSDVKMIRNFEGQAESQSLWNRAVSSDSENAEILKTIGIVSIPLEQGSVFRRISVDGCI